MSADTSVECIVEYDYQAEMNDELTLRVGDVVTEVDKMEGGWWRGRLGDKIGMFPDNFVKVLPGGSKTKPIEARNDEILQQKNKKWCRVLFSYEPVHEDELELKVDQLIEFLAEVEDGWWRGRLGTKMGVFPSNFVEMCNSNDCDIKTAGDAMTVDAKNKKNSLGPLFSNGLVLNTGSNRRNSSGSSTDANINDGSKKTNGKILDGSKRTPPDTAPRLPPKREDCGDPADDGSSPVLLRRKSTDNNSVAKPLRLSLTPSYNHATISSNLFDPEDEEPIGPMFGALTSQVFANSPSDCLSQIGSDVSSIGAAAPPQAPKTHKGFFSRIRHSFGSRPRLPKFLTGSRLSFGSGRLGSVSCHENHSAAGFSPNVRRRNSFADFWLKKTSLSKPVECKKAAVAEDEIADTRLSKSLEMAMARNGEVVGPTTSTPRLPACDEGPDTDTVPVDLKRAKENNPETSMSWVWQEMGPRPSQLGAKGDEKQDQKGDTSKRKHGFCEGQRSAERQGSAVRRQRSLNRNVSNDSGLVVSCLADSTSGDHGEPSRGDKIFGSVLDFTDEVFDDMFGRKIPVYAPDRFDSVNAGRGDFTPDSVGNRGSLRKKKIYRNCIRTNPWIRWTPPKSVLDMQLGEELQRWVLEDF